MAEALDAAAIDAAADAVDRVDRDAQLVDAVLDQLTAAGHLSDDRFAESRIHARQARFGNRRIVAELREHGLLVPDAQRLALRDTEFARARQVLLTRFGGRVQSVLRLAESSSPVTRDDTARERARMQRFLLSRGFSPDVVRAAVASLAASADDDADTDDG